jgi:hypothetical protein
MLPTETVQLVTIKIARSIKKKLNKNKEKPFFKTINNVFINIIK